MVVLRADQRGDVLTDAMELLRDAVGSPWVYAVIFAVTLVDAFLPLVPSETAVITAGVFAAATGEPSLVGVIAVAAVGAAVGDHVSYAIGRASTHRQHRWTTVGTHRHAVFDWGRRAIGRHGAGILITTRYIPGGRTVTTLLMGATHYPRRVFAAWDAVAAISWAMYAAAIGFLGGRAFEDEPLRGIVLGLVLALCLSILVEVGRRLRYRASKGRAQESMPAAAHRGSDRLDHVS